MNIFVNSSLESGAHFHIDEYDRPKEERRPGSNGKDLSAWQILKANPRDLGFGWSALSGDFVIGCLTVLTSSLMVGYNSIFKYSVARSGTLASGNCPAM